MMTIMPTKHRPTREFSDEHNRVDSKHRLESRLCMACNDSILKYKTVLMRLQISGHFPRKL